MMVFSAFPMRALDFTQKTEAIQAAIRAVDVGRGLSDTDIGRGLSWADLSGIDSVTTRSVYAIVLRTDLPSPLAPESDEEKGDEKKQGDDAAKDSKKKGDDKDKAEEKKPEPVRIDFDGIGQRIVALPLPAANVQALAAGKEGGLFVSLSPPAHFGSDSTTFDVRRFNLEKRKDEDFLSGVRSFDLSSNGERVLYRKGKKWSIAGSESAPKGDEGALASETIQVRVGFHKQGQPPQRQMACAPREVFPE